MNDSFLVHLTVPTFEYSHNAQAITSTGISNNLANEIILRINDTVFASVYDLPC